MAKSQRPAATREDPWDSGDLGRSLEHAALANDEQLEAHIDLALNLQPISIRLEKGLIEAFKFISAHHKNIGYQTLMRQALHRFATAEVKNILRQMEARDRKEAQQLSPEDEARAA